LGNDAESRSKRSKIALDVAQQAVAQGRAPDYGAVKKLVVSIHRQRLARSKIAVIELDKWSFRAFFKHERGWKKPWIKEKWAQIKANPQGYRTSMETGTLTVMVPKAREISLEDVVLCDTVDAGKTLELGTAEATQLLLGRDGGVTPGRAPTASVGGPSSVDAAFDDILEPVHKKSRLGGRSNSFSMPPKSPSVVSPGPAASARVEDSSESSSDKDSDSDDSSDNESCEKPSTQKPRSIPSSAVSMPVVQQEPSLPASSKRSRAASDIDHEDDAKSDLSKNTKVSKSTVASKGKKAKKGEPVKLDLSEYPETVSRPLVLSEIKHQITDYVQHYINSFEVLNFVEKKARFFCIKYIIMHL